METNATTPNAQADAVQINKALERRLDLVVAIADLDKEIEQRLKKIGKTIKMPGFRPGKVPANVVKQQYGMQARHEALGELGDLQIALLQLGGVLRLGRRLGHDGGPALVEGDDVLADALALG